MRSCQQHVVHFLLWAVVGLLAITAGSVAAQDDLSQRIELSNGYHISLPGDWYARQIKDTNFLYFESDNRTVFGLVLDPFQVAAEVPLSSQLNLRNGFLRVYYSLLNDERIPESAMKTVQVGAYPAIKAEYEVEIDGERFDNIAYFVEFDSSTYGLVNFTGYPNALVLQEDLLFSIVETLLPESAASPVTSDVSTGGTASTCLVSIETANTAALRVGPGFNRASILYLPAGQDFTVVGIFTTEDGEDWFQLVKEEVAPQSAANELWVLRGDVQETGDCDAVGSASAPPIVPISAPPANPPAGGSTTSPSAGLISLTPGSWSLFYAERGDASCQDGDNFNFRLTDYEFEPVLTGPLVTGTDGNSFTFYGVVYTRTPGTNSFRGLASFDDGTSNESFATLTSASSFVGSDIFNVQFDGVPCSTTIQFTARRNG